MVMFLTLLALTILPQDDVTPPNYEEHVQPILREWCFSCHRGSRAKNGLDLRSVKAILAGGSSGPAVAPGDAEASLLWRLTGGEDEPHMPPDEDLPEDELSVLRRWIEGGARVDASDQGSGSVATVEAAFVPPPAAGPAPVPEGLSTQPVWWSETHGPVTALAASPGAPMVAIAGHRQVTLVALPGGRPLGVLPFEDGTIHDLAFSPSGAVLLATGGRGADRGLAVGFDMRSGERLFAVGDEPDQALAGDISADHARVALGGPDRVLRLHGTHDGALIAAFEGHTEWVTATRFSPDGVLLASGDRNGGLFVLEGHTGREFHTLPPVDSRVTSLAWRADSNVLAVGSEDGQVRLFRMEDGRELRKFRADSAVLDLAFGRDGTLLTVGRDGRARTWDSQGKQLSELPAMRGPLPSAALSHDGKLALVGQAHGRVGFVRLESGELEVEVRANLIPDELRAVNLARRSVRTWLAEVAALDPRLTEASARQSVALATLDEHRARTNQLESDQDRLVALVEEAVAGEAQARAELENLRPEASQREAAVGARQHELDAAREAHEAAQQAMTQALEEEARAEEAWARQGTEETRSQLDLARRLAEGASAQALLSGEEQAKAEVALLQHRMRLESWQRVLQPREAALVAAVQARETQQSQLEAMRARVEESRALVATAEQAHGEAAAAQDALRSDLQAARRELTAAQEALPAVEAAWAELEQRLGKRGRVREAVAPTSGS